MYNRILLNAIGSPESSPVKVTTETFENYGDCVKLTNGVVEVFVTKEYGPRIICYRLVDGKNIFGTFEKEEVKFVTDLGEYYAYGGHRLWQAPEAFPATYSPDNAPVKSESVGRSTVRFVSTEKDVTGLKKEIYVSVDREGCGVTVTHTITNKGLLPVEVAPWGLTVVDGGGVAIVPQEPFIKHGDSPYPARPMVLWPYTDLSDTRWTFGKKYVQLKCDPDVDIPQKFGVMDKQGWAAYSKSDRLFVKRFAYDKNYTYPDYGCNVEVFTRGGYMELETLGHLEMLQPGESATHVERWFLFDNIELGSNETDMSKKLIPILHKTSF